SDNLPILGFPAKIPKSLGKTQVIVGTNLYRVINNSEFNSSFIFQLLRSANYRKHILSNSKGSTVRMITKDSIEEFEFKVPPVEALKKLEANFIAIDEKIESNVEQVHQLEQTRNSLLPKLMSGQ